MGELWLRYLKLARNKLIPSQMEKRNTVAFMNMYEILSNFKSI